MNAQVLEMQFRRGIRMKAFIVSTAILLTMIGTVTCGQYDGLSRNRDQKESDQQPKHGSDPAQIRR
jgi:hypothetical protein